MNPSVEDCNPLLLTDGTVIVSDCGWFGNWYKLTPDITGSYANGTWTQIATMPVITACSMLRWATPPPCCPMAGSSSWR